LGVERGASENLARHEFGQTGREGPEVPFGKQESSDQCQPVHAKNPQQGSPDSGPVAAQPARAPIVIAIVTFCAYHPSSRWIADLLGGPVEGKQSESR
jgi:hypothetical protein